MKRVIFAALIFSAGVPHLFAAPTPAPQSSAKNPACELLKGYNAKERSDMQGLDAQIKTARAQSESQLKPLEEEKKSLAEQFRSQRYALMDQIQPGYGDAIKAFDEQQKALSEKEQEEIRAVREKYEAMRRGNKPPKANLNCH